MEARTDRRTPCLDYCCIELADIFPDAIYFCFLQLLLLVVALTISKCIDVCCCVFFGEGWPTTILSFIATCTSFSWRPSRYANPALYVMLLLLLLLKRVCALNTDFFRHRLVGYFSSSPHSCPVLTFLGQAAHLQPLDDDCDGEDTWLQSSMWSVCV